VVNTTGTPYFKKQPLRDVVVWYGLSQGIADNILKSVGNNIHAYNFDGEARQVVAQIVGEFFDKYRDVSLPDGSPAKLAMYFPQTDDLRELRPAVEAKLVELGLSTGLVLERHSDSGVTDKDAFERINDPASPPPCHPVGQHGDGGLERAQSLRVRLGPQAENIEQLRASSRFPVPSTGAGELHAGLHLPINRQSADVRQRVA